MVNLCISKVQIPHIKAEMLQTYQDLYFTINLMLSIL
jgi:hypothetical protein